MSFTVSSRESASANSLDVSSTRNLSGESQLLISQAIADGASDQLIALSIDISQVRLLAIKSDQALTIKTNNSGAPDDTLSLLAGIPRIFRAGEYDTIFLTADVTAIYVTNASGSVATLQIISLEDLP